jgi:hypothetical protein
MILYVNGCSHSAAAEAAVPHSWACDDGELWQHGEEPHPANLAVSYGRHIADALGAELICQASSGGSNDRIIRTTQAWIKNNPDLLKDTFMILQWTTWEREEWLHNGTWYQVNASGWDIVPPELQDRYKNYIINVDWNAKTLESHQKIWEMHLYLKDLGIRHLSFSAHSTFSDIYENRQNWGLNYIGPYSREKSYNAVLINNGFGYVNPQSYHFGADAHCFWADYLLQYINNNQLLTTNEISTD